ncbi:MAG: butyrate kinase [Vicinamibacterales bacterium]
MFDIEASFDQRILALQKDRPTVIFTEAGDARIVEAACFLGRFIRPMFLADEHRVRALIASELPGLDKTRVDFTLSESAFVDLATSPLLDEMTDAYIECCREHGQPVDREAARAWVSEPSHFGICAVRLEHADMVVGGVAHRPRDFFRPMLRMLAARPVLTEAGVFVLPDDHPADIFPHNIVVFGDVGVNATMTPELLAEVAVGTCAVARDVIPEDILPEIRGAIVSYSNRGSDEGPSPELVRQATALVPDVLAERVKMGARYQSIRIEGEVKISVALSRRSAMYYHEAAVESVQGGTNVIICPNIEMGNLLYHLYATRYPSAKKFPVMFGLRFRGVDLAMDSSPEDVRLAVKASLLRLHRFGAWQRTPRDTFFRRHRVLAINPGSTSTKVSVYEADQERFTKELQHSVDELLPFEGQPITAQFVFRKQAIECFLAELGISMADIDAVAARGGLLRPIPHGTYVVDGPMLEDLRSGAYGEHASNLGGLIANELVAGTLKPAFIVDPVVVDEIPERAKITGIKAIRRRIVSHALNEISVARRFAEENETFYEKVNVIVAHMGGGISVGAHRKGRYIDVNNALDGEGPFTPQRSGSLPVGALIELCFSGRYTHAELKKLNRGRGGLIDLLGTADLREVERRIDAGDAEAALVFDAMTYQIARWITSLLPAFEGEPLDRVILTGGMARSSRLVEAVTRGVSALSCGVTVYPGENEMYALVKGALRVLDRKEQARRYRPEEK